MLTLSWQQLEAGGDRAEMLEEQLNDARELVSEVEASLVTVAAEKDEVSKVRAFACSRCAVVG